MNYTFKLKELREKSKKSQRDVAKLLNMSQANFCDIENGKVLPNSKLIIKLCNIFNCTPNDLLGIRGIYETTLGKIEEEAIKNKK